MKKKYLPFFDDIAEDGVNEAIAPQEDVSDALREQNAELENKILRLHADMANVQRRAMEDARRASADGAKRLIEQLLPVMDTLQMALGSVPEEFATSSWIDGIRQFEKMLQKALADAGLEPMIVEPGVTMFDPQFHEGIGRINAEEAFPAGTVSQVYQPGYMFQGAVLRSAKVQVAD